MEVAHELFRRVLALTYAGGLPAPHRHEGHLLLQEPPSYTPLGGPSLLPVPAPHDLNGMSQTGGPSPAPLLVASDGLTQTTRQSPHLAQSQEHWASPWGILAVSWVYVDDFVNGLAGPPLHPKQWQQLLWFGRAALHSIHAVFPMPEAL